MIKHKEHRELIINKLVKAFNNWLRTGLYPEYFRHSRMVALSKEDTQFPSLGAIHTIAVTPSISKVFEKIILIRLRRHIDANSPLSETQAGFTKNKSTLTNINKLAIVMKQAK